MGKVLVNICAIAGIIVVALVLFDVFQTIIVPRISSRHLRIAPVLVGVIFWPIVKGISELPMFKRQRNAILEAFAPLSFIILMLTWLTILVIGYGLILYSMRTTMTPPLHNFFQACYFAGTSVLTLGFGDVVAFGVKARCVVLAAATSGLLFMALAVSYLFSLQSLVQQREQLVNTLISRAGAPASGLVLLLRYKELNIMAAMNANFLQWEHWTAGILESHRAYPLLLYFRSTTNVDSWLSVLGAMLDAASIMMTSLSEVSAGEAELFYWIACSTVKTLSTYIDLDVETDETMEFSDFAAGLSLLRESGYNAKDDQHAWKLFKIRRSGYQPYLRALCKHLSAPPQTWIEELAISQISVKDSIADSRFQP